MRKFSGDIHPIEKIDFCTIGHEFRARRWPVSLIASRLAVPRTRVQMWLTRGHSPRYTDGVRLLALLVGVCDGSIKRDDAHSAALALDAIANDFGRQLEVAEQAGLILKARQKVKKPAT